ncbi:alpha/beta fold hydrolase [Pandoraea pulmonicola]|uniref:Alpha/beta hydrolase n=1 Tax=Pandoraea pulmonicola TaxID=93221 RepID=A0AAJ4ZGS5_PANPU|nr:alpha/beta hydrolase [Pandoraea pulmonicola]AJC22687.1 alpha/beta hydrolase [Pandoraea pulmonicola]SUA93077.1 Tropinesterase [Pandoraea pulmonicola]
MSSHVPRLSSVQCLSPSGLHRMAYTEWGNPDNPRVLVCVHGLTRCGRDFDVLAQAFANDYRVICPDVVGRGQSSWLRNPAGYVVPQYVADMVTLLARLDVASVDWFGTSMGGLIGMGLAGLPETPIRNLLLNDVGPHIDAGALARIGQYVGVPKRFASMEAAEDYLWSISSAFGPHTPQEWRALCEPLLKADGDEFVLRYDPAIGAAFTAISPEAVAAGEAMLWASLAAFSGRTLIVRGEQSDLLSRATMEQMLAHAQHARAVEIPGVGHAPTFVHADQIEIARRFFDGDAD